MKKEIELPEMVEIPASEFVMGDIWGDGEIDEKPLYKVFTNGFYIGRYAVTVRQFADFLNDLSTDRNKDGKVMIDVDPKKDNVFILCRDGRFIIKEDFENYPVTRVSWYGAVAYCDWLSWNTGKNFRLPAEYEWQYASMGSQMLKWGLGNEFLFEDYVRSSKGPENVAWGKANEFGLFNVTGNVFEWCSDEYSFELNNKEAGKILKQHRVIKGGSFILGESANFRNSKKFSCFEGSCLGCVGFRVVCN